MDGIETRCVIITGEGRMFSAGYDIGDIPEEVFAEEAERLVAHPFHRAIEAVEEFPFPTLAAVNGHALGGGLELAVACDLRLAAGGVKLGMPPGKLGLIYSHTGLLKFIDTVGAGAHARAVPGGAEHRRRKGGADRARQRGGRAGAVRGGGCRARERDRRERPALDEGATRRSSAASPRSPGWAARKSRS